MSHSHVGHYADATGEWIYATWLHIFTLTAKCAISMCGIGGLGSDSAMSDQFRGAELETVYERCILHLMVHLNSSKEQV